MSTTDYRTNLTDKIISLLEKGTIPWQKEWDNPKRPFNPKSEKAYRGMNSLSLSMTAMEKGYNDPRWCTFNQAKENSWHILAGEKGSLIEYWKLTEKRETTDSQGNITIQEEKLSKPMVCRFYVFNAEQMTGVPSLEIPKNNIWQQEKRAEELLKNSGATIIHQNSATPYYDTTKDIISLPLREQFRESQGYYATALHELGHWTGAEARLSRNINNNFGTADYAKEELRAELASYFLSADLGIKSKIENHASYIDHWVQILKNDKNEIFRAATDAEKIADYVLGFEKEKVLSTDKQVADNFAKADVRLMVDYKNREDAKALGAIWDKDKKTWYAPKGENLNKFTHFMGEKVVSLKDTPLFVNFNEKNDAKTFGAFWDKDKKLWFIPSGGDIKNIPDKFFIPHENIIEKAIHQETFKDFAIKNGLLIGDTPIADGKFHRVPVDGGKPNAKDGSYVFFDDAAGKAGWIKNFKTGFEGAYGEYAGSRNKTIKTLSSKEIENRKQEQIAGYNEAAKKAGYLVSTIFTKAETHPYLEKKGIKPHNALIDKDGALIIPLKNSDGKVRTFQRILSDGTKGYMKAGEKCGSHFTFGSPKDKMLICEGFATGASLYEATRIPTIAAMDTSNLERVAKDMREKYGERMGIVIAADNDHMTKDNPGIKFAENAAKAVNGKVVSPQFTDTEKNQKLTDFNDLSLSRGKIEVKKQIAEQVKELFKDNKREI